MNNVRTLNDIHEGSRTLTHHGQSLIIFFAMMTLTIMLMDEGPTGRQNIMRHDKEQRSVQNPTVLRVENTETFETSDFGLQEAHIGESPVVECVCLISL